MGVIQWKHLLLKKKRKKSFSESILFLKMGSLSVRTFWKWGSFGEDKMWKVKRGSFSDERFENGGQCGRTYPSRIFRKCLPQVALLPTMEDGFAFQLVLLNLTSSPTAFLLRLGDGSKMASKPILFNFTSPTTFSRRWFRDGFPTSFFCLLCQSSQSDFVRVAEILAKSIKVTRKRTINMVHLDFIARR